MAHYETAMDIDQKFWTIRSVVACRSGKKMVVRTIEEHSVDTILIFGDGETDIAYCYDGYMRFPQSEIGKSVFLSEADAQLAMDRMEEAEK